MTYSVTDEDGYERTYDEDEIIEVRKGDLRAVLDVATMSMDFGSGFLDNEQVEALRKAAIILGLDPKVATPANFTCHYDGAHDWRASGYGGRRLWRCVKCAQTREPSTPDEVRAFDAEVAEHERQRQEQQAAMQAKHPWLNWSPTAHT